MKNENVKERLFKLSAESKCKYLVVLMMYSKITVFVN